MKNLKMPGLAAIAAAALVALVGASSASATVLCKTKPITEGGVKGARCPEGWAYPAKTENHAVNVGPIVMRTAFKNIECTGSTIQGDFENEGSASETVKGPVTTYTLTGCNCSVTVLRPGNQEVHWIPETTNATITTDEQEVTATCSSIFGTEHCIYVTHNKSLGISTSSEVKEAAILDVSTTIERSETDSLCEEEAKMEATYETTAPKPLWFASHT